MKLKDRTGIRYGRLVVQSRVADSIDRPGRPRWRCLCDCGKTKTVEGGTLQSGGVTSCGCALSIAGEARQLDLIGQRFGKLTVRAKMGKTGREMIWLCDCDCGGTRQAKRASLRSGKTTSCGCGRRTHNMSDSPTYQSWDAMISRTTHSSNAGYAHYQRLGITVCDRWRNGDGTLSGFSCFLADMGERPSRDYTLDRIDGTGNYEPGNCRWATRRQQGNNRSTNKVVTYKGVDYTMAELARATGLSKELLRHRITRAGWPVAEAVETPNRPGWRRDRM